MGQALLLGSGGGGGYSEGDVISVDKLEPVYTEGFDFSSSDILFLYKKSYLINQFIAFPTGNLFIIDEQSKGSPMGFNVLNRRGENVLGTSTTEIAKFLGFDDNSFLYAIMTDGSSSYVAKISPTGELTQYDIPSDESSTGLTDAYLQGNILYVSFGTYFSGNPPKIYRFNKDTGAVISYLEADTESSMAYISVDEEANIYFTDRDGRYIYKMTDSGNPIWESSDKVSSGGNTYQLLYHNAYIYVCHDRSANVQRYSSSSGDLDSSWSYSFDSDYPRLTEETYTGNDYLGIRSDSLKLAYLLDYDAPSQKYAVSGWLGNDGKLYDGADFTSISNCYIIYEKTNALTGYKILE